METEIEKMSLESKDLVAERIEQMKALFPEIVTEGEGSVDFEKLRLILGDEVDESQERYAFTWPGKADAIRQAQIPSTATLRPDKESSVNWDTTENLYIEGDNLEVLKLLQRGYHGKVKMIYIDPPYNTGHDFVYKDSFQDSIENYREQAGLSGQSNADTSGRYHSDWLSMMYPRLKLARELLGNDGVIFISINDAEQKNLLSICNEIFGESNYIGSIIRKVMEGGKGDSKTYAIEHEYCFVYAKSEQCTFNRKILEHQEHYNKVDQYFPTRGYYYLKPLENGGLGYVPSLDYPIKGPDGEDIFPGGLHGDNGYRWVWGENKLKQAQELGMIEFVRAKTGSKYKVYYKIYEQVDTDGNPAIRTMPYPSLYLDGFTNRQGANDVKRLFEQQRVFDYPKPVSFLRQMIAMGSNKDSLVMDFFSGSTSFGEAVMEENRKSDATRNFICVQMPEPLEGQYATLCDLGEERIRRAGQKIKAEIEEENKQLKLGEKPKKVPDIGFRVLKLDSSNFDKVEGGMLVESIVKADRTHEDIIFEMMVKWGLDLSLPMEETEMLGYPITSIAADELICCMDEGLTIEILEAIAGLEPKRVFFLDSVLTDTVKLNAAQIFKRASERAGIEIELRTV